MLILGLTKTTLLDYPGHVAASLFTGGCNFRCPYCHNRDIVLESRRIPPLTEAEIFSFLEKRRNVLSGVCITGGEPTLHLELPDFIRRVREYGYLVKLDTNGTSPRMLARLIGDGLIDYCAMDIKNVPEKYGITTGAGADFPDATLTAVKDSVRILLAQQDIHYEFRTTVVRELHSGDDLLAISQWISGADAYFLQSYTDSEGVLCGGFHAYPRETLETYAERCRQYVPDTALRG